MIYPMFAMFLLTVIVLAVLFLTRVRSIRQGLVSQAHFLTYSTGEKEPDRSLALSRNFTNLFEAPILFYVVCVVIMVANLTNPIFLGLAWAYVFMRALHSFIHTGSNNLSWRIFTYMMSWVFLTALWIGIVISKLEGAQ